VKNVHEKGISVTLSTVILTAVVLSLVISIGLFASNVVEWQNQAMEFEEAKVNYIALAELIEHVAMKPNSSGYIRINSRAGGPYFIETGDKVKIRLPDSGSEGEVLDENVCIVAYKGGSLVSTGSYSILRGITSGLPVQAEEKVLVKPGEESIPLGWVYTMQENGAWICIDFARARVTRIGVFAFVEYVDSTQEVGNYGIVEITYIKIFFPAGKLGGSGVFFIKARNYEIIRWDPRKYDSTSITIRIWREKSDGTLVSDDEITISFSGINNFKGIIVYVNIVRVAISTR